MTTELNPLEEKEKDISYAIGFIRHWLETANPPTPKQALDHLQEIATGVNFYREKYVAAQQALFQNQNMYNQLMAQSALYLQAIQQKQDTIDQMLIESQREYQFKQEE